MPNQETIRTFYNQVKTERVIIYKRTDGTFGFEVEKYSDDPDEQVWIPYGIFSHCICESEELILREVKGRISWLSELENES